MYRIRFKANIDDPRPIDWSIKHPYWISGEGEDYAILVAYADSKEYIYKHWPEAKELDILNEADEYIWTDRFPKPKWFGNK